MALINSSSFSILNARTVSSILKARLVQSSSKYPHIRDRFFKIKETSNTKILITVNSPYSSNIEKIYDNIIELFTSDVLLRGQKVFVTGDTFNKFGADYVLNLQRSSSKVQIFLRVGKDTKKNLPEILQPGILNEEYFAFKISEQLGKINESKAAIGMPNIFSPNLNILLREGNYFTEGGKMYMISGVKDVERVGQEYGKSDINITTNLNKKVKISLKKENFGFWSSAKRYGAAKKILDYLVNQNIISFSQVNGKAQLTEVASGNKLSGIRLKATPNEIRTYCFGTGNNKVDYILIQTFFAKKFSEIKNVGNNTEYNMRIFSKKIYRETANDIIDMMQDVYLGIFPSYQSASRMLSSQYPGLDIRFITNANSARYYEPEIPSSIPLGRL